MKNKFRVFIVDDNQSVRQSLAGLINSEDDLEVCGEAAGGLECLQLLPHLKPDIALIDLMLIELNGFEVIKKLKSMSVSCPCLIVSMYDEKLYAKKGIEAGASGYLMKSNAAENMVKAIRTVLSGQIYLSDSVKQSNLSDKFKVT